MLFYEKNKKGLQSNSYKKIKQNKTKKPKQQQQQNNNLKKKKNYPEKVIPSKGDTPRKWKNLKVTFLISSDLESDRTKKILT